MLDANQFRTLARLRAATRQPDPESRDDFLLVKKGDASFLQHPGFATGLERIDVADLDTLAAQGYVEFDATRRFVRITALEPGQQLSAVQAKPARRDVDAFLSHASEDSGVARDIAAGLRQAGFGIWFDRFELKVGDRILDEIKKGLAQAAFGILLVSEPFLRKYWPQFETSVLQEGAIEGSKRLLPVWHQISKDQVKAHDITLAGIYALRTADGIDTVVAGLAQAMVGPSQTVAVVPSYESPVHRFFQGIGELTLGVDGPAFTLWEALVHLREDQYPLFISGQSYSKSDLVTQAMLSLGGLGEERGRRAVGDAGMDQIDAMIRADGGDPELFRS